MTRGDMTPESVAERPRGHGGTHVGALDGVRGIAILAVVGFHFAVEIVPGGAFGVDLFFGLSAFLITGMLLRERRRFGRVDLKAFYVRRVARLFPALVVFLVLIAPPIAAALGNLEWVPLDTLAVAFYVADFGAAGLFPLVEPYGHTWSLAVEEQFYLIWPAVLLFLVPLRTRLIRFGLLLFVLGVVIAAAMVPIIGVGSNYFLPTGHLPALAAGILAAFIAAEPPSPRLAWFASTPVAWTALAALVAFSVLPRATWPELIQSASPVPVLLLVAGLILHAASGVPSSANRFLANPVLRWFGTRSYGIYLYHTAIYWLFASGLVPLSRTIGSIVAITISLVISELSYRYIERPFTEKGRQWSAKRRQRTQPQEE